MLDKCERIEILEEAREHLETAVELIEQVFPSDKYVRAYMIDQLRIRVSSDHGFLSGDLNMDNLIERLEDEEEE